MKDKPVFFIWACRQQSSLKSSGALSSDRIHWFLSCFKTLLFPNLTAARCGRWAAFSEEQHLSFAVLGLHHEQTPKCGSKNDPRHCWIQLPLFTGGKTRASESSKDFCGHTTSLSQMCKWSSGVLMLMSGFFVPLGLTRSQSYFILIRVCFLLGDLPPGLVDGCFFSDLEFEKDFFPKVLLNHLSL